MSPTTRTPLLCLDLWKLWKAILRSALAIVHEFVANQGDGWVLTSGYLDRFVDEQRLLSASDQSSESDEQTAYMRYMQQTGKRVAEMQVALASRDDIDAFRPETTTPGDIDAWIENVLACAERVFSGLQRLSKPARESDRVLIDELVKYRDGLRLFLETLLPRDVQGLNIRHHGDLHLGQLLIVKDDIFIIDFEGEPRRSLAERRRKAPAARDIAGLIRSIDYSTAAAYERALQMVPDESGQLAAGLEMWRTNAVAEFLSAYHENLNDERLWPSDAAAATRLLNFFLVEKVFYEIEYELAHRPEWLRVPLNGALRILASGDETA